MSKFVQVQTELRDLEVVRRVLAEQRIPFQEDTVYLHRWSGRREPVALLLRHRGASFGLRPGKDGALELVGDDMAMGHGRELLKRLQQRYAYHFVRAQVEAAGFELVEEKVDRNQVIRLTVRRWG